MNKCKNCKHSYILDNQWLKYTGCKIVDETNNISLRILGDEGKCPYYSVESYKICGKFKLINNVWMSESCTECCVDCSSYCELNCPEDIDGSCDRCEFKNGYKKDCDKEV